MALVDYLKSQDPATVHNIDDLLLRESMDVIGGSMQQLISQCAIPTQNGFHTTSKHLTVCVWRTSMAFNAAMQEAVPRGLEDIC